MNRLYFTSLFFILLIALSSSCTASEPGREMARVHHDLNVRLEPAANLLIAEDSITLPADRQSELRFVLHGGLEPITPTPGVRIERETAYQGPVPVESFRITFPPGIKTLVLRYKGSIHHPLESVGKEQARGYKDTPGIISKEGIYLSGSSFWYPKFENGLMTFTLEVKLPKGWDAVSQGARAHHVYEKDGTSVRWKSPEPQDEIYLVAGEFTEYTKPAGRALAMVFLRKPDEVLANKYLDATVSYLAMYEKLIGFYPYKKFALVENFWETGFGMPSFTLLGPTVIRLPFIISSSYPHEILHNWWGNSVFPVYEKGNWSEGLTAYLSDHLIKEQQGAGAEYRVATLQKYADYVLSERDFPLTEFRARHSAATEAVGYGKSLMFFHMLRLEVGDKAFIAGLQDFYRNCKFGFASFTDLERSFETVSKKNLKTEFDQWVTRSGAPEIRLSDAGTRRRGDGKTRGEGRGTKDEGNWGDSFVLTARIRQIQSGKPYRLQIPVAITLEGKEQALQTTVEMKDKERELALEVPSRPLRIDVDPEFDIFRRLDRDETPPAITQALGAKKMLVLLPSSANKTALQAYREFADVLSKSGPDEVEAKLDNEVKKLPRDCAVTILGWENRFLRQAFSAMSGYEVAVNQTSVKIEKSEVARKNHSFVFTARNPENKDTALMMIASDTAEALPGLGRKLPHYHKYSYLAFEGDEPANVAKGRWPVVNSPMTAFLPGKGGKVSQVEMGRLASRESLASLPQTVSSERMMETVKFLSSDELKGRGLGTKELDLTAEYIAKKFQEAGLAPGGDKGGWFQEWEEAYLPQRSAKGETFTKDQVRALRLRNVIGIISGKKQELSGQSVVVGAHYDHLGTGWPDARKENKGKIHPGADDNASGVAVLLELARVLAESLRPDRSVVFVAFTGEDAGRKGSKYYVQNEKVYPVSKCIGMINLDTVGRLEKKKLLVLGAGSAKEWVHIFRGAGFVTGVEIETVSEELDSSDQKSFQDAGIPAVQLFTGPHLDYHRPTDTADKIDPDGLVKVASVAKEVVEYLAGRQESLTATIRPEESTETAPKKERKVSLGTIPDFVYKGEGVRLSSVMPGSPAEAAGLKEGDVIIRIYSVQVKSLRDLSDILKSLKPGDTVSIVFLRDGKEMKVETEVKER